MVPHLQRLETEWEDNCEESSVLHVLDCDSLAHDGATPDAHIHPFADTHQHTDQHTNHRADAYLHADTHQHSHAAGKYTDAY